MEEKIKISGIQMEPKIMEKEENLARCIELIRVAAKENAKLIVFPECALTGYCYSSLEEALPFAEQIPGPSTDTLIDTCRELDVYVVTGLLEIDGDKCLTPLFFSVLRGLWENTVSFTFPILGLTGF